MYANTPDNTSPAIPTMYRGIRMRSRLEAKWAYFMDGLGWQWEYEPIDLNGWIPDFVIKTYSVPLLVDVKPIFKEDTHTAGKILQAIGKENVRTRYDALILAAAPFKADAPEDALAFGWITDVAADPTTLEDGPYWDQAIASNFDGTYGITSAWMSYACRITGAYDGNFNPATLIEIRNRWNHATNAVQWFPKARS